MAYTDTFGGTVVHPSDVSFNQLTLNTLVSQLSWPGESSVEQTQLVASRIVGLDAKIENTVVRMPRAEGVGPGETVLFHNYGVRTVEIEDSTAQTICIVEPGKLRMLYLVDNSTAAGKWQIVDFGSSSSIAAAGSLAGSGLFPDGQQLSMEHDLFQINSNYTMSTADRAKIAVWTGATGSIFLPLNLPAGWFVGVRNAGEGTLTLRGGEGGIGLGVSTTVDNVETKLLNPGEACFVFSDGSVFYTIGHGRSAQHTFDYTSINVQGGGIYNLVASDFNRIAYRLTGALTANRTVIVPPTLQQYWVRNDTSGAYTLTIKTASGSGVIIGQGQAAIMYCDGTNVVLADTAGIALPVAVNQGGTGGTTAATARANLGATSVGSALFTASSPSAARSALGLASISGGAF